MKNVTNVIDTGSMKFPTQLIQCL